MSSKTNRAHLRHIVYSFIPSISSLGGIPGLLRDRIAVRECSRGFRCLLLVLLDEWSVIFSNFECRAGVVRGACRACSAPAAGHGCSGVDAGWRHSACYGCAHGGTAASLAVANKKFPCVRRPPPPNHGARSACKTPAWPASECDWPSWPWRWLSGPPRHLRH